MILGLTGSVGSGKSTVAGMLQRVGNAEVIDADDMVHRMQQPGEPCFHRIVEEFGTEVVAADGALDRRKLGAIVFNDSDRLQVLNSIVHPMVWQETKDQLANLAEHPLVVVMVPLLYEIGADKLCDKVAVVSVSEPERIRRLMERDGMTTGQIARRLAAQLPQAEKEKRADFIIDNSADPQHTLQQVKEMLSRLNLPAIPLP